MGTRVASFVMLAAAAAGPAMAGVPFVTDDPGTPDQGHFEIDVAGQLTHRQGDTSGVIPSVEVDYGALDQLELHLLAPLAFDHPSGGGTSIGPGDLELGIKYRFIEDDDKGWRPALAFAPTVTPPTGDASRGLGTGRTHYFLPVWASKKLAEWTVFGGGGYNINPGPGNTNFWFVGAGATYDVSERLTLGGEVFDTTHATTGGTNSPAFNLGLMVNFTDNHHFFLSAGRNLAHAAQNNQFSTFVGYQLTF